MHSERERETVGEAEKHSEEEDNITEETALPHGSFLSFSSSSSSSSMQNRVQEKLLQILHLLLQIYAFQEKEKREKLKQRAKKTIFSQKNEQTEPMEWKSKLQNHNLKNAVDSHHFHRSLFLLDIYELLLLRN